MRMRTNQARLQKSGFCEQHWCRSGIVQALHVCCNQSIQSILILARWHISGTLLVLVTLPGHALNP